MKLISLTLLLILSAFNNHGLAQDWKGKKCAVVLSYDDALNTHLDKVIPALNAFNLKATFYLVTSKETVTNRIKEWSTAAKKGHELGNHSHYHPCLGHLPGRSWVSKEIDMNNYAVTKLVQEIQYANQTLKEIDGQTQRSFAYPCGDFKIRDSLYYPYLKNDFIAARGVLPGYLAAKDVDLTNVNSFVVNQTTAEKMIAQIEEAERKASFIVFLFHGVGGEHALNIDLEEHQKLLEYLKKRKKDIWIPTMLELSKYIQKKQLTAK